MIIDEKFKKWLSMHAKNNNNKEISDSSKDIAYNNSHLC